MFILLHFLVPHQPPQPQQPCHSKGMHLRQIVHPQSLTLPITFAANLRTAPKYIWAHLPALARFRSYPPGRVSHLQAGVLHDRTGTGASPRAYPPQLLEHRQITRPCAAPDRMLSDLPPTPAPGPSTTPVLYLAVVMFVLLHVLMPHQPPELQQPVKPLVNTVDRRSCCVLP